MRCSVNWTASSGIGLIFMPYSCPTRAGPLGAGRDLGTEHSTTASGTSVAQPAPSKTMEAATILAFMAALEHALQLSAERRVLRLASRVIKAWRGRDRGMAAVLRRKRGTRARPGDGAFLVLRGQRHLPRLRARPGV